MQLSNHLQPLMVIQTIFSYTVALSYTSVTSYLLKKCQEFMKITNLLPLW